MGELADLYREWSACTGCPLAAKRKHVVVGEPYRKGAGPLILVIGEAPGQQEDEQGRPWVGAAGTILRREVLEATGVRMAYLCNVVACFPGDTTIEAVGVEKAYRRRYSGQVVQITTSNGGFTVTPNHPILTDHGWIAAGLLQEGSHLVRTSFRQEFPSSDPHVDHGPVSFEELFRAVAQDGVGDRIVGSNVDFHGDGGEGQIDVVKHDRQLLLRDEATGGEHLCQGGFTPPHDGPCLLEPACSRLKHFAAGFGGPGPTAYRVMGGLGDLAAMFRPKPRQAGSGGFGFVTEGDVAEGEQPAQSALPDMGFLGQRLDPLSSKVSFDQVVKIQAGKFEGHVYNLQTACGQYTANGYVVSNCRPPANRDPAHEEIKACSQWINRLLGVLAPAGVLAVGRYAEQAVEQYEALRGIPVAAITHPAALLRKGYPNAATQRALQAQVGKVRRLLARIGDVVAPSAAAVEAAQECAHTPLPCGVWRGEDGEESPLQVCSSCGQIVALPASREPKPKRRGAVVHPQLPLGIGT